MNPQHYPMYATISGDPTVYAVIGWHEDTHTPYLVMLETPCLRGEHGRGGRLQIEFVFFTDIESARRSVQQLRPAVER
jgi:hypothetical protein